ncbi:MAG: tetratricopeptide repeat protein [Alphaproteobacteria bacterium]|nr:tetratricopeptide repeat protein [Alphaproteobacteria bacterium]MCB9691660.1 tetratricopeptide repeat protein [Alphaproteobacteria bacterium]
MRFPVLLAVAFSAAACAKPTMRPPRDVQDVPRWRTEKDTVRLEIVEKLLDGGDAIRALHMIAQMRDEKLDRPELDLYQGIALRQQGMTDDAERLLLKSRVAMPKSSKVERALCVLYADSERVDEALASCDRATDLDPEDAAAWNNYGFLLLGRDPAASREALQHAVDLEPTNPRYRNNLAYAQAAVGDHRAALKTFLTTGSPADAHYNVGIAFERAGDDERALSYYQRALKYDAEHVYADEAVRRLRAEQPARPAEPSPEEM